MMCISTDFCLITHPNKTANFFGGVIPVLVWNKKWIPQIYLLDFDSNL